MDVGQVDVAFSGPTLLCLVSFFGGHNSGTASMATAVSAGVTTTSVRGGVGLCYCTTSVITLVTVAAAKKTKKGSKKSKLRTTKLQTLKTTIRKETRAAYWTYVESVITPNHDDHKKWQQEIVVFHQTQTNRFSGHRTS